MKKTCALCIHAARRRALTRAGISASSRLMTPARFSVALFALILANSQSLAPAYAQEARATGWNVEVPRGAVREISFDVQEGTFMSLDVSPDGRWIVFDLLGHIYKVSSSGGQAECLTQDSGIAMNYHPRFSPDGLEIAFISDRGGQDNLWVMGRDGGKATQIVSDMNSKFYEPAWSPDGRQIYVTRRLPISAFERTLENLWVYPRAGGAGAPVVESADHQLHWASPSRDGTYLYYHQSDGRGRDQNIKRLNLRTGQSADMTAPKSRSWLYDQRPMGEYAPEVSPDGRYVAFARKIPGGKLRFRGSEVGPRTALWVRDLKSGEERVIVDPLDYDLSDVGVQMQSRIMPGYAWAPDSQSLYLTQGGGLRRAWLKSGRIDAIAFNAAVRRKISAQARGSFDLGGDTFQARALRWPASSSDGASLVFEAAGRIWRTALGSSNGPLRPAPLVDWGVQQDGLDPDHAIFERTPSWSPNNEWVLFTTWREADGGGHVWKVRASGGTPQQITREKGNYLYPEWLPNGDIVANRWDPALERTPSAPGWQLVTLTAAGKVRYTVDVGRLVDGGRNDRGEFYFAAPDGIADAPPRVGPVPPALLAAGGYGAISDGQKITALMEVDPRSGKMTQRGRFIGVAPRLNPSPDGRWIALEQHEDVFLASAQDGAGTTPGGLRTIDPPRAVSLNGGTQPRWRNTHVLEWMSANTYFSRDTITGATTQRPIELLVKNDRSLETIAFTHARLITLDAAGTIENASIVVRGDRIACMGECDVSAASTVIDASGKTITPGWVDVHAHQLSGMDEELPVKHSDSARSLAYGVTTVHDPWVGGDAVLSSFAFGELVRAGRVVGPRSYSTGRAVFPWSQSLEPWTSPADAEREISKRAALGSLSIKNYALKTRYERQWLIDAARRAGQTITAEGQGLFFNISLMMDGSTGWEHWLHELPLRKDAAQFLGSSQAYWSPQLYRGGYPNQPGLEYWLGEAQVQNDPKVLHFSDWQLIASRSRSGKFDLANYPALPMMAQAAVDVHRAGGSIAMGGHGEITGLDLHWEVWTYAMAARPIEALEAATIGGARFLGLEKDLGTLAVGKLADLVILNANPLENIRNTRSISYVMKAGRLYNADKLDEIFPRRRPYGIRPWALEDISRRDTRALSDGK